MEQTRVYSEPDQGSGLSNELQLGKAGEHVACADLLLNGVNAYLSDQGLPYDMVADVGGKLFRIQVKSTMGLVAGAKGRPEKRVLRFDLRCGKGSRRRNTGNIDCFAFVWLREGKVAYVPASDVKTKDGTKFKILMEFRTRDLPLKKRRYPGGKIIEVWWGRYFEDFSGFRAAMGVTS